MSTSSGADMPAAAEGVAAARWPSHTSAVLAREVRQAKPVMTVSFGRTSQAKVTSAVLAAVPRLR